MAPNRPRHNPQPDSNHAEILLSLRYATGCVPTRENPRVYAGGFIRGWPLVIWDINKQAGTCDMVLFLGDPGEGSALVFWIEIKVSGKEKDLTDGEQMFEKTMPGIFVVATTAEDVLNAIHKEFEK